MVDVGSKPDMIREATATGQIFIGEQTLDLISKNLIKKGDVLAIAEFAAINAAKKTSELIPLCHPLMISNVKVDAEITDKCVEIRATVGCTGKTGVEMEALTAVAAGLLAVYDMCKAVDKEMVIKEIKLLGKTKKEILP